MLETVVLGSLGATLVGQPIRNLIQQRKGLNRAEAEIARLREENAQLALVIQNLPASQQQQLLASVPMQHPPSFATTWEKLNEHYPDDAGMFPLGWVLNRGEASLVCASITPFARSWTGHMLLTGCTRFGKDTLAFGMLWSLCMRNRPEDLQIVYIDGKRSDGGLWAGLNLAHLYREPYLGPEDVPDAMQMLSEERKERERQRVAHRVTEWKDLDDAVRPPQLVVYVSELSLLEAGCSKADSLENWLARELSSSLASGITYLIGAHSVSNWATAWRDHCQTFIAGYRDKQREVEPNLGITPTEVEARGGISPHLFTERGFFTLRNGPALLTCRSSNIPGNARNALIAQLPTRTQPLSPDPELPAQAEHQQQASHLASESRSADAESRPAITSATAPTVTPTPGDAPGGETVQPSQVGVEPPPQAAPPLQDRVTNSVPMASVQHTMLLAKLLGIAPTTVEPTEVRDLLTAIRALLAMQYPGRTLAMVLAEAKAQNTTIVDVLSAAETPTDPAAGPRRRPWQGLSQQARPRRRISLAASNTPRSTVGSGFPPPALRSLPTRDHITEKLTSGQGLNADEIRYAVEQQWYSVNQLVERGAVTGTKGVRRQRIEAIVRGEEEAA